MNQAFENEWRKVKYQDAQLYASAYLLHVKLPFTINQIIWNDLSTELCMAHDAKSKGLSNSPIPILGASSRMVGLNNS